VSRRLQRGNSLSQCFLQHKFENFVEKPRQWHLNCSAPPHGQLHQNVQDPSGSFVPFHYCFTRHECDSIDWLNRSFSSVGALRADGEERVLNPVSRNITLPKSQGASQAMLYAVGLEDEDMKKPQIGISSVWWTGNPCNKHLLDLSNIVRDGVHKAGLFNHMCF